MTIWRLYIVSLVLASAAVLTAGYYAGGWTYARDVAAWREAKARGCTCAELAR